MLYSNWTEPTWLKRASETFEKFKNQVEKEGFFLGLYYDIDKDCSLVVVTNKPTAEGVCQTAYFIFPVIDFFESEYFLETRKRFVVPGNITGKIYPVDLNCRIGYDLSDAIRFFKELKIRLEEGCRA